MNLTELYGGGTASVLERALREELRTEISRFVGERQVLSFGVEEEARVREMIRARLAGHGREAANNNTPQLPDPEAVEERIFNALLRLGPLQPLMDDEAVEDIIVNGPDRVFAIREGVKHFLEHLRFESEEELLNLTKRLIGPANRLDASSPSVDAQLPDGSRLHAEIPPATTGGPSLTIRKFVVRADSLDELVALGTLTPEAAEFLTAAVQGGANILVSGPTRSGKTTLVRALCSSIETDQERVITIEDVPELRLDRLLPDCVGLQARPANVEGKGEITIRQHVKSALRMSPTRIVVGEVRGAEALDMLMAWNTGHDGSIGTIHANTPRQALDKLATLAMLAEEHFPIEEMAKTVAHNVHLVLQLRHHPVTRKRQLTHIYEVVDIEAGKVLGHDLWALDRTRRLVYTGITPRCLDRLSSKGVRYEAPPSPGREGYR